MAAGLLVVEVRGTRRLYQVDRHGIEALRGWPDGFWGEVLDSLEEAAERVAIQRRKPNG